MVFPVNAFILFFPYLRAIRRDHTPAAGQSGRAIISLDNPAPAVKAQ
jgi:hypothetical protein